MEVHFSSRKLERCYSEGRQAIREWGPQVGRRYVQRVGVLIDAVDVTELHGYRALGLHPLRGDRQGQHALRLTGQMRLIVTVLDDRTVRVEEVTDYHE